MKAKKILSALLTGALILGAVSFTALADDGLITEIKTAEDLVAFAESVNAGNSYAGKTVTLTDNIDLQGAERRRCSKVRLTVESTKFLILK